MFLNDSEANAKAEPGALPDWLGRIKRIENALRVLEPGPGIGKQNDDVPAVAECLDGQYSAAGGLHRFQSIADDIEKDLHQLIAITANAREH